MCFRMQRILLNYAFEIGGMQTWKGISFKILKYNVVLRTFETIQWCKLYIKLNYFGHDKGSRLQAPLRSLLEKIGSGLQTIHILPKYLHMEYIYISVDSIFQSLWFLSWFFWDRGMLLTKGFKCLIRIWLITGFVELTLPQHLSSTVFVFLLVEFVLFMLTRVYMSSCFSFRVVMSGTISA